MPGDFGGGKWFWLALAFLPLWLASGFYIINRGNMPSSNDLAHLNVPKTPKALSIIFPGVRLKP